MKIFITAPFKDGNVKSEIEEICSFVSKAGFEAFCFFRDIENYQKKFHNPRELMQRAREELLKCQALLIDYDGPASGRMIEVGMAYAAGLKIVLIMKKGAAIKETVKGVADSVIEYENLEDIVEPLSALLRQWQK